MGRFVSSVRLCETSRRVDLLSLQETRDESGMQKGVSEAVTSVP